MTETRKLRVFLCHSSQDKPIVRQLYQRLNAEGWIDAWLDEEKLFPGQVLDIEIKRAVETSDAVIVCLSNNSVTREGYVQKELRYVLDVSDEKPEETIYVMPVRLDDCLVPQRLKKWLYVEYFPDNRKDWAYNRLLGSFSLRAENLQIEKRDFTDKKSEPEKIKRPTYSSEYAFTNLVKQIWTPIAGIIGAVILIYEFVGLWKESQSTVTWFMVSSGVIVLNVVLAWIGFSVVKSKILLPSGVLAERFRFDVIPRRIARVSLIVVDFLLLIGIVYFFLMQ